MYQVKRPVMYSVLLMFLLLEAVAINSAFFNKITAGLFIIFTIFFGLFYGWRIGLESGIVCGVLKDITGIGFFGINTFIFGAVGFICGCLSERIYRENFIVQFVIAFVASVFVFKFLWLDAFYTAVCAPFVIAILRFSLGHFSLSAYRR